MNQPFKSAVLNSSPRATPALYILYVSLIASDDCSIRTKVPCEVDNTGYSALIPVQSERICSIQSALKCAIHEFKLYIFTEVYCHTRLCVKMLRCTNPLMNVPK